MFMLRSFLLGFL
uniref:Uncharacterized protein n=1 Tax=Rhizophora mucronata TaxID=61149 RepID=A0A2P2PZF2_RHIMU